MAAHSGMNGTQFSRRRSASKDPARWVLPSKTSSTSLGQSFRAGNVKRWDGFTRVTQPWGELRRDPELWDFRGDCLVYLYGRGQSRRGPSFQLSRAAIEAAGCAPLFEKYAAQTHSLADSPLSLGSSISSEEGYFYTQNGSGKHELYIPAPPDCNREDSFNYHMTTRNLFAWMVCKPLVGEHLGRALVGLFERMNTFRSVEHDNMRDLIEYLDDECYTDFRECADHALAVLYFAEQQQQRELWTDAFCHCVGMHDRLIDSKQFEPISRVSKALITRAKLEMDIRIDHGSRQLTSFLDNELSGTYLGVRAHALAHLEKFRSFLHSFYVGKFGYWPPQQDHGDPSVMSKSVTRSMYVEFRNLYEYLVDEESTSAMDDMVKLPSGGLCVLQNVVTFDKRHRHQALPHPLPLVPQQPPQQQRLTSQKSLDAKMFSRSFSKAAKIDKRLATLASLSAATNAHDICVMECPLVRAYMRFEKESTMNGDDKVTASDGRKVRWILIYGMLQTLISITRCPIEVRDTENVTYSLCCQLGGTPPWTQARTKDRQPSREISVASDSLSSSMLSWGPSVSVPSFPEEPASPSESLAEQKIEIVPDTDYLSGPPAPLRARTDSIKAPRPLRLTSVSSWCEHLIHGYGNGTLSTTTAPQTTQENTGELNSPTSQTSGSSQPSSSRWSLSSNEDEDDDDDDNVLPEMDHLSVDDGSRASSELPPTSITKEEDGALTQSRQLKPRSLSVRKTSTASVSASHTSPLVHSRSCRQSEPCS